MRRTAHELRRVRRALDAGRGAYTLKLDELRGDVVHCVVHEYGAREDVTMERGTAVVEVWTDGNPEAVVEHVAAERDARTNVVCIVRPATFRHHMRSRWRWRRWRFRDRLAQVLRAAGLLSPTYFGRPLSAYRGDMQKDVDDANRTR